MSNSNNDNALSRAELLGHVRPPGLDGKRMCLSARAFIVRSGRNPSLSNRTRKGRSNAAAESRERREWGAPWWKSAPAASQAERELAGAAGVAVVDACFDWTARLRRHKRSASERVTPRER